MRLERMLKKDDEKGVEKGGWKRMLEKEVGKGCSKGGFKEGWKGG